jgi:hypothetical protein
MIDAPSAATFTWPRLRKLQVHARASALRFASSGRKAPAKPHPEFLAGCEIGGFEADEHHDFD